MTVHAPETNLIPLGMKLVKDRLGQKFDFQLIYNIRSQRGFKTIWVVCMRASAHVRGRIR